MDRPAQKLYEGKWAGDTAETYHTHRVKLTGDMREAARIADTGAEALESAATNLRNAQRRLDTSWATVTGTCPYTVGDDSVTFHPTNNDDVTAVNSAIKEANDIRDYLDDQLLTSISQLSTAQSDFGLVSVAWAAAAGGTPPFKMPPEITYTDTILDFKNQQFLVNTGTGNDTVEVRVDPHTGKRIVVVNGLEYPVPDGMEITVRTSAGDDTITVPPGTRINLTVLGGSGTDKINTGMGSQRVLGGTGDDVIQTGDDTDRVSGNAGADRIHTGAGGDVATGGDGNDDLDTGKGDDHAAGGDGMDYLSGFQGDDSLHGGGDQDVVYAGSGDDTVSGGVGDDYIDGGQDNDSLDGGSGTDVVSGGQGNDTVLGGSGDDTLIAGDGSDTVEGGPGTDKAYTQQGDSTTAETVVTVQVDPDAGSTIQVEGSDEFRERVQDDLDTLRSLPGGQRMLAELDRVYDDSKSWVNENGNRLTIREIPDRNGFASYESHGIAGEDYTIKYNPRFYGFGDGTRPVTTLYHEMAHVYDYGNDTQRGGEYDHPGDPDDGQDNTERQAVGLTVTDDPFWPWEDQQEFADPDHPERYTENGLRKELGLRTKEHYTEPPIR